MIRNDLKNFFNNEFLSDLEKTLKPSHGDFIVCVSGHLLDQIKDNGYKIYKIYFYLNEHVSCVKISDQEQFNLFRLMFKESIWAMFIYDL